MENLGIIEVIFGAVGFAIFYVWQMRSLKRDKAALKARQAAEAKEDSQPE
ncbi:MAG: hypothetical protein ABL307_07530 [Roseitalea porphyridii]